MDLTYTSDDSAGMRVWTAQTDAHEVRIVEISGVDYKCEILERGAINRRRLIIYAATLEDAQQRAHRWMEDEP